MTVSVEGIPIYVLVLCAFITAICVIGIELIVGAVSNLHPDRRIYIVLEDFHNGLILRFDVGHSATHSSKDNTSKRIRKAEKKLMAPML